MAGWVDKVYQHSPVWVQNLGVAVYGFAWKRRRMGGYFLDQAAQFSARDRYSAEEWHDYQTARLRELLVWCSRESPYYRRTWAQAGLQASDLAMLTLDQLARLPLTDKDELRQRPDEFVAGSVPRRHLHTYQTSGSTGTPLSVKMTARTHQAVYASYEARCRRWVGLDHTMSRAMIGGRTVVPQAVARPPFWRYNPAERQLYLSIFHIGPTQVAHYVAALNCYRPDYLVGYASAHFFLARLIEEAGLAVHSPRAVLTSSEKLTAEMRDTLSRVYRCDVFDGYSGVESCCLASECEHHRLHVSPDVGIIELLDRDGRPVPRGEVGEIVATGLLNFDQPLVRYRTGDLAAWSDEACPCGRVMPVLRELVGRLEDTVIGLDGRELVGFNRYFYGFDRIREAQVVQEALDHFRVRVVVPQGLTPEDRESITRRFRERLGPVRIDIEPVDAIERTARGKFRAVISKVPRSAERTAS